MAYKFNPFTGTLDYYQSASAGTITGIPPTNIGAITRWANTTATLIENSPGTNVQDSGAIEAQMFITNRNVTGTVTVNSNESAIIPGMQLQPGSIIILQPGAELIVI